MARSLRLPDPAELAGHWEIYQRAEPSKVCALDLEPNSTLAAELECVAGWLGEAPVTWFPEPDGISLTGKEGSRIIHFGRQKEGLYQATLKSGIVLILQRAE